MQKKASGERHFFQNPSHNAWSKVRNQEENQDQYNKLCCIDKSNLKYPVINIKCTALCYMSMKGFLEKFGNLNEYKCPHCKAARQSKDVVYDIGFQTILKSQKTNKDQQYIVVDKNGHIKSRQQEISAEFSKVVSGVQSTMLEQIRKQPQDLMNHPYLSNVLSIEQDMNKFYKTYLSKNLSSNKDLIFCRGRRPAAYIPDWYGSIYVYNGGITNYQFQKEGKPIEINQNSEIHYVKEKGAFYIVAWKKEGMVLYRGQISNMSNNKIALEEYQLNIPPRKRFSVAHTSKYLFLIGGEAENNSLRDFYFIDLETLIIKPLVSLHRSRANSKACYLNNKVYVVGGVEIINGVPKLQPQGEVYELNKEWRVFDNPIQGLSVGVISLDKQLVIFGGYQNQFKMVNPVYCRFNCETLKIVGDKVEAKKLQSYQIENQGAHAHGKTLRTSKNNETIVYLFDFSKGSLQTSQMKILHK